MYACHCFFICFSVSEQQKNSRTSRTQGYSYPVILNVRLFGNSFRFRGSVQSSVIQLFAHFLFVLNVLNLRLPLRSERSISFTYPHFGHLISMFPVVIVTLSKIRHSQRLHLTITFCSSLVKSYTPPDKQQGSQTDYQDNPCARVQAVSFVLQVLSLSITKNLKVLRIFHIPPDNRFYLGIRFYPQAQTKTFLFLSDTSEAELQPQVYLPAIPPNR